MRQCVPSSTGFSVALGLRGETGVGSREGMEIPLSLVRIAEMRQRWLDVYFREGGGVRKLKTISGEERGGVYILVEFRCLRLGFLGCPPPCIYGTGDLQSQRHLFVAYRSRATPHTVGCKSISSLSPTARNAITSRRRGRERRRDRGRVEGSCGEV